MFFMAPTVRKFAQHLGDSKFSVKSILPAPLPLLSTVTERRNWESLCFLSRAISFTALGNAPVAHLPNASLPVIICGRVAPRVPETYSHVPLSLSPPSLKDGTWRAYVFFVSHHTIYGSTCALLVLHSLTGFMKRFDIFFLPNSTIAPIHYASSTKFFQLQLLTAHGAGPA